jgi:hypothetical protein
MYLIAWIFAAALLGIITGFIAQKKGYDFFTWWLFGTVLFIVALIIIIALPQNTASSRGRNAPSRKCPYCGANAGGANNCPECNRTLPDLGTATVGSWEKTVTRADDVEKWSQNNPPQ